MNLEEYNYWNDHRVQAGMINRDKVVEENGHNYIIVEDDDEGDIKLLCKWGVCPTCEGNGSHVNPSIDAGGISSEDFYDDPDFAEAYFGGAYNQTCNECNGRRVVPEVDRENNPEEMIERYDNHLQFEAEYAAEVAAERRMGA